MKKKIKLETELYKKARKYAAQAGYSSVDEFVHHMIEKEINRLEQLGATAEQVEKQLRGLGYIS